MDFLQKINHDAKKKRKKKKKTQRKIFYEGVKRIFYEYVHSKTPLSSEWAIFVPDEKDEHTIRLILSWKYGTDALLFTDGQMLYYICQCYKEYDPMDYYFRKYEEHVF